jgi:RimJ/RimL family protein N-acetyltransferase
MSYKIYFKHNIDVKINSNQREKTSFLKIRKQNFLENKELIQQSIDKFNSEIKWDEMWNLDDANDRLTNGEILYILLDGKTPLGHVWYDLYYLYNAFVSESRKEGDSVWFIQETMWDMKSNYNLKYIKLYVDDWNTRAIKFWEKLGFINLS